jgi:hypothetical protein
MQSHIFLEEICVTLNKKLLSNFPTIAPIDSSCTLEEYLEKGIDIFKLENHFNNWNDLKSVTR